MIQILYVELSVLDELDQSRIGIRLVHGKVDIIVVVLEVVLEVQRVVVLSLVVVAQDVDSLESYVVSSFEPSWVSVLVFLHGEDWD